MPPHTRVWDETDPDDLDEARFYAQELRETKIDVRERMEVDHEFDDQIEGGKHKKVTLIEQGADAAAVADANVIYSKEVAGKTELFSRNSAGDIAQITSSGLSGTSGHSANEAEMKQTIDPGVSGTVSLATTLFGELDRLRRVIMRIALGNAPKRIAGGAADAGWFDGVVRGASVVKNGAFLDLLATTSPLVGPYGWTLINANLSNCTTQPLDPSRGSGRALELTDLGSGARGGIKQTLKGLKAGAKYLVVLEVRPMVGSWKLATTGADAGAFTDLALISGSATLAWERLIGVIQTSPVPADIEIIAVANTASAKAQICLFDCFALDNDMVDREKPIFIQRATWGDGNAGNLAANSTTAVVCPGPGYEIRIETSLHMNLNGNPASSVRASIEESTDGGVTYTVMPNSEALFSHSVAPNSSDIIGRFYTTAVQRNPIPGTRYHYRVHPVSTSGYNAPSAYGGEHMMEVRLEKI